jgi:hypothetical protein
MQADRRCPRVQPETRMLSFIPSVADQVSDAGIGFQGERSSRVRVPHFAQVCRRHQQEHALKHRLKWSDEA